MSEEPPEAEKFQSAGRFLTEKEMNCLKGIDTERKSQRNYRIRNKTLGALSDLFTVGTNLDNDNAKKLFEGVGNITTKDTTREAPKGDRVVLPGREGELSAIVALGCRGYQKNCIGTDESVPEEFVSVLENGVEKGIADSNNISPNRVSTNIEIDVEVHEKNLDPLEKWRNNMSLTRSDWQTLHERVSNHPDVDDTTENNPNELIQEYLITENDN